MFTAEHIIRILAQSGWETGATGGALQALHEQQQDSVSANSVLDRMYQLQVRQSGPDSEEMLPVLRQQAAFYQRHKMYRLEYTAWYRSLVILRRHRGPDDRRRETGDPREVGGEMKWDGAEYFAEKDKRPRPSEQAIEVLGLEEEYSYVDE